MHATGIRYILVGAVLLTGCATTGDPQSGGLFGWSENKARERQHELARRDRAAHDRAADEQARSAALRGQQDALDAEAQQLQQELVRLQQENRTLDARLRKLLQQRRMAEGERQRLQSVLDENTAWLAAQAAAPAARDDDVASRRRSADQASRRNERLQREVGALLSR
ncbi:MAG: hypothetical protein BGP24_05070 [Lysobacterales bacterium 69-70]|nr:hypothetical protein [Xanthomonadaceae bacterium]ODU34740.1 MAG: hypothetical protein ABS97_06055 [Xanthomonadaceae bacterium SCN 69-320]ODV15874.1 MAG: hypothetical protein ABT27_21555 [Xanthomonadaceae bacterium SCN 69-25]OJY94993.1 MAG: hypothetical protein BGP24_05070 [Xanthomonadales bacterium 69-70]